MVRVALTGGIATGKSHVLVLFAARGVPTIDADVLAREALAPGSPGADAVRQRFGPEIVDATGTVDRKRLGAIVFADAAARRDLESIVHPAVYEATRRWLAALPPDTPFAMADIPLLYETGRDRDFDTVVVAACDPAVQLQRVMKRDGLPEADARARIAAQLPIAQKIERADYVIWTSGTIEETAAQVDAVCVELTLVQ